MRVWAKVNPCGVWLGINSKFMNFCHPSRSVAMLLLLAVDLIQCISPGLYVYDLFSHSLHDACDPHDPSRPSYHGKLSSQSESPSSNMLSVLSNNPMMASSRCNKSKESSLGIAAVSSSIG